LWLLYHFVPIVVHWQGWFVDKNAVRGAIDLLALAERDTTLKKGASTKGGEYVGPCPFCGGLDRFHVWPDHPSGWSQFWCRACQRGGDAIAYVMERDGLTFLQVCREYDGGDGNGHKGGHVAHTRPTPKPAAIIKPPSADWQNVALLLVADFEMVLWSDVGKRALDWLRSERGLSDDTIRAWRLGYCPADGNLGELYCDCGVTIPWADATGRLWKVNVRRPTGEPKYRALKGSVSNGALFGADRLTGKPDLFVTEGEFDAMLLHQAIGDVADVVTLGSESGRLCDNWLAALLTVKRFFCVHRRRRSGRKGGGPLAERGR